MNPNLCRVALRPRGPFEVFDLTLRFVRTRQSVFLRLAGVTVLPAFVVSCVVLWGLGGLWALAVAVVLSAPIQAPFTVLTGRLLFAPDASLLDVLRDTLQRLPALALTWLVLVPAGALALTVAGLLAQPAVVFLPETALLERVPLGRGMGRALRLAGGHVGAAVMAVVARWGLLVWRAVAGELTGQLLTDFVLQLGQPFGSLQQGDITPWLLLGALSVQPFVAVYRLLLYLDVRTRTEGWDLQVGLRALGLQVRS